MRLDTMRTIGNPSVISLPRYLLVAQMILTIAARRNWLVVGWSKAPATRRFGGGRRTTSNFSSSKHENDSDAQRYNILIPKGEFHLLPRLYVGEEPKTHRLVLGENCSKSMRSFLKVLEREEPSSSSRLFPQSRITLSEDQSHYLISVMRIFKKKNQPLVRLFDGVSGEWLARVSEPAVENGSSSEKRHKKAKKRLEAECLSILRPQTSSSGATDHLFLPWLCIAVPSSKDRWRWLLEKATELSVGAFLLLETDFSSTTKIPSLDKAAAHAIEAAEQSERLTLPSFVQGSDSDSGAASDSERPLTRLTNLLDAATSLDDAPVKWLICRERAESTISLWQALTDVCQGASQLDPSQRSTVVAFCVGPEGGWSREEEAQMDGLQAKFPSTIYNVSLGPTVLRMETAAMTALASYTLFVDQTMRSGCVAYSAPP